MRNTKQYILLKILLINLVLSITLISCDNGNNSKVKLIKSKNTQETHLPEVKELKAINPEVDFCLNNIGQDVKLKNFSAATFSGNKCGITRFGKGIGLNVYNSFYQSNQSDKNYILLRLKEIATKYGYKSYSILISDNEGKLMIDREVDHHQY
ncbi:MAG: hypothetical protein D3919_15240 [Candidatus Electrothrix sp. AW5]|nr:hypothetical protein [Candidatus Electrothrix gigas]MCI5227660.1 hypothetical protein [Candidatus Electrothrix gigas]